MDLLASLKPEDVEQGAPAFDYSAFSPRSAVRAIVYDGKRIALIHVSKHGYYMLPGGGVDGDDLQTAIKREVLEELGTEIEISGELGVIEVYIDKWNSRQIDHCFVANVTDGTGSSKPTAFEQQEGHELVWAENLDDAIKLVEDSSPANRDGKLVQARDLLFLETARKLQATKP